MERWKPPAEIAGKGLRTEILLPWTSAHEKQKTMQHSKFGSVKYAVSKFIDSFEVITTTD